MARPRDYIAASAQPVAGDEELPARRAAAEALMLGLRTAEGTAAPAGFASELHGLERDGLVEVEGRRVIPTRRGMDLHNQIALAVL